MDVYADERLPCHSNQKIIRLTSLKYGIDTLAFVIAFTFDPDHVINTNLLRDDVKFGC